MVQAFSLGPNKHKRGCLRYLGAISRFESGNHHPSLAFLQRIAEGLGKKIYVEFSISKSAVDFESVFEVEKRLKK